MAVAGQTVVVLAVLIPPSRSRPHFSGPAYVRRGSQTIEASAAMMDELVAARIDKVRVLQRLTGLINIHERSARGAEAWI